MVLDIRPTPDDVVEILIALQMRPRLLWLATNREGKAMSAVTMETSMVYQVSISNTNI